MQAHSNQDAIGWNNFLKGWLSKQWSKTQQSTYDTMNRRRNARCQDFLAPKYSGQWWASNLIKQIISYSLNEWQIRNNKLHAEITENQYSTDRTIWNTKSTSGTDVRQNPPEIEQIKLYSENHYSRDFR